MFPDQSELLTQAWAGKGLAGLLEGNAGAWVGAGWFLILAKKPRRPAGRN